MGLEQGKELTHGSVYNSRSICVHRDPVFAKLLSCKHTPRSANEGEASSPVKARASRLRETTNSKLGCTVRRDGTVGCVRTTS